MALQESRDLLSEDVDHLWDGFAIDSDDDDVDVDDVDVLDDTETLTPVDLLMESVPVQPAAADSNNNEPVLGVTATATTNTAPAPAPASNQNTNANSPWMHPLHPSVLFQDSSSPASSASASASTNATTSASVASTSTSGHLLMKQTAGMLSSFASRAAHSIQSSAAALEQKHLKINNININNVNVNGNGNGNILTPPSSSQQTVLMPPAMTLDPQAKAQLLKNAVGELLPGEKVIMFLTSLQNVKDSSHSHLLASPQQDWSCAMTFYRLILLSHGGSSSGSSSSSSSDSTDCHEGQEHVVVPDWRKEWVESASVSRYAQHFSGQTNNASVVISIPLASMDRVDRVVLDPNMAQDVSLLKIFGKDNGRMIQFATTGAGDAARALEALQTYAFPGRRNLGYLFAFESRREQVMASMTTTPQTTIATTMTTQDTGTASNVIATPPTVRRFDAEREWVTRQGVHHQWHVWRHANAQYQLCASYPHMLVGPMPDVLSDAGSITNVSPMIRQTAVFRSEKRLPVLTWGNRNDKASIWRCSQPKVGLQGNRSSADERFLAQIGAAPYRTCHFPREWLWQLTGDADLITPPQGVRLVILDLRPKTSAIANRTGGYGYENTSYYTGSSLTFCNVGNIHAVRDAYQKVSSLCTAEKVNDVQWTSLVEDTKWLQQLRYILSASWQTAYWAHIHRLPVVVHCSHGWDRTSQVAALAQLMLDGHYRTLQGFATLVEKDFMSFGHPFHTRCGHGEGRGERGGGTSSHPSSSTTSSSSTGDEGQISPIFIQFLDGVYQLVNQYPHYFEFSTRYLLALSEHVYSCRFGTLLCDTEREREVVANIRQRTHCLWEFLEESMERSVLYDPSTASKVLLMPQSVLLRNVTLWTDRHALYGPKPTLRTLPKNVVMTTSRTITGIDMSTELPCAQDWHGKELAPSWPANANAGSPSASASTMTTTTTTPFMSTENGEDEPPTLPAELVNL